MENGWRTVSIVLALVFVCVCAYGHRREQAAQRVANMEYAALADTARAGVSLQVDYGAVVDDVIAIKRAAEDEARENRRQQNWNVRVSGLGE